MRNGASFFIITQKANRHGVVDNFQIHRADAGRQMFSSAGEEVGDAQQFKTIEWQR